jgi:fimbrial isopeptide formation D2 family protein/LPXTG-motif cell wall-anchored protein
MKRLRKISGFLLATFILFVIGITPVHAAPTVPAETEVTIHKIVGTGGFQLRDHDGRILTPTEIAALGTGAVENNTGVQFTAWPVPAGTLVNAFKDMTDKEVTDSDLTGEPVVVNAGVAHSFGTGTYYVRETKHPATLETQIGVPFVMELPALKADNSEYLTVVHLYPKNVIENDKPEIDKDVKTKEQDNAGFDVGYTFDYLIYPKVPAGIESYTVFEVSDALESTLDYMGNVVVTYNGVTFANDTDYTLLEDSSGTAGGGFTLTFKKAGLEKLAINRPQNQTLKELEIKFNARMNNTALMGTEIKNNAVLTYNNGYTTNDQTAEVPLVNRPEVHTGGRQFIKVDNVTQTYLEGLASASFVVKNEAGKYMKKDAQGNVSWVAAISDATKIDVNDDNGTFEVTGLAYGDNGAAFNYSLVEIDVPTGYVKMDALSFTIDASSYGEETIDDNTKVINVKKPIIPQTGGIGSVIFLTTGLTMMGAAVVALKRKEQVKK